MISAPTGNELSLSSEYAQDRPNRVVPSGAGRFISGQTVIRPSVPTARELVTRQRESVVRVRASRRAPAAVFRLHVDSCGLRGAPCGR